MNSLYIVISLGQVKIKNPSVIVRMDLFCVEIILILFLCSLLRSPSLSYFFLMIVGWIWACCIILEERKAA